MIKKRILAVILMIAVALGINVSAKPKNLHQIRKTYRKKGVTVRIYEGKHNGSGGKARYYAAHVILSKKAYNKMHIAKANGKRSKGFQTIKNMVKSKKTKAYRAVLAVNGPFNGKDSKKWNAFGGKHYFTASYHDYCEIYGWKYSKGKLGSKTVTGCATYSGKTGLLCPGTEQKGVAAGMSWANAAREGLISDTFAGDMGGEVLIDGKPQGIRDRKGLRPRTFIGTNGKPGDFWIVVCNGQNGCFRADPYSKGLNTYGEGVILKKLGCKYGYNLDGGGSSTMVFLGKVINKQPALRTCYDALYISR